MALNLSQKKEVVAELAEVAAKAHSLVAVEYDEFAVEVGHGILMGSIRIGGGLGSAWICTGQRGLDA